MSGTNPVVQLGACPRCHGDLEWDSIDMAMKCRRERCGYSRPTLRPEPKDLIVVEGAPHTNGHTSEGGFLSDVAKGIGITPMGLKGRVDRLGIPLMHVDGRPWLTSEQIRQVSAAPQARRQSSRANPPAVKVSRETIESAPPQETGESRQVRLQSGGTVTVSVAVPWLSLSPDDRAFVFGLVDALARYEVHR